MRRALVTLSALFALAGCEDSQVLDEQAAIAANAEGFPEAVSLDGFEGSFFPADLSAVLVERAEENEGDYRALVVDVTNRRIVAQIVGPREEQPRLLEKMGQHALDVRGCGIGQGVFTPPPVPPPPCGGIRCEPSDYIARAMNLTRASCPRW